MMEKMNASGIKILKLLDLWFAKCCNFTCAILSLISKMGCGDTS